VLKFLFFHASAERSASAEVKHLTCAGRSLKEWLPAILSGSLFLLLGMPALAIPSPLSNGPSDPRLLSVVSRGSTVTMLFRMPKKPSGVYLFLSVDGNRLLGRRIVPGAALSLCVGNLSSGSHQFGYQTARADHIVLTDPLVVPVTLSGGAPFDCPPGKSGR